MVKQSQISDPVTKIRQQWPLRDMLELGWQFRWQLAVRNDTFMVQSNLLDKSWEFDKFGQYNKAHSGGIDLGGGGLNELVN